MLKQIALSAAIVAFVHSGAATAQERAALSDSPVKSMSKTSVAAPEDPGHGLASGYDPVLSGVDASGRSLGFNVARLGMPAPLAPNSAEVP